MDETVREQLAAGDADFRELQQKHGEFDRKLAELMQKPYLSAEDEVEEVRLKKRKLQLKDQMEARCATFAGQHPVHAS